MNFMLMSAINNLSTAITAAATQASSDKSLVPIGAGIAIAIAAGLAALGIGLAASKAFESMAKQPEMAGKIQSLLFVAIVFIEATAIYALVVALLLVFVF